MVNAVATETSPATRTTDILENIVDGQLDVIEGVNEYEDVFQVNKKREQLQEDNLNVTLGVHLQSIFGDGLAKTCG